METPVLTQSEKSKALSGNKSKKKKKSNKIYNVLGNFATRSSIKLSEENSILFEEKLSEFFQYTMPVKPTWNEIKDIPKEKRAELRQTLIKSKSPNKAHLLFGINEITRAIENRSCTIVLLSNDITPVILTRHICEACHTYKIPLLEIQDLRKIILKCFGFPSITVAFKNIPEDSALVSIMKFLISIIPEIEILPNIDNTFADCKKTIDKTTVEQTSSSVEVNATVEQNKQVYLYRENKQTRCYVPSQSISNETENEDKESKSITMDFIEFESDYEMDGNINEEIQLYKKLKIKKIRPNPNRLKGKKKK